MAAGKIGPCWANESWTDTAWSANTWGAATPAPWTTSGGSPPVPVGYYKREYVGRPGKARDYTKVDAPTLVEAAAVTAVLRPPAMEEPSVGIARALASAQRHGGMQHEWQRTQQAAAHVAALLLLGEFDD